MPRNSGPSMPCSLRYSQMAWVMARTCCSLKLPSNELPRWPEVPNATRCAATDGSGFTRSEEHTSELQSLMRISYAVFCLKKKKPNYDYNTTLYTHSVKTTHHMYTDQVISHIN